MPNVYIVRDYFTIKVVCDQNWAPLAKIDLRMNEWMIMILGWMNDDSKEEKI